MTHRIFLSHNHNDKPVVEPVAIRLAAIFGQDQVFYDSWPIKPGDGIIDEMNKGLEAPEFVFFFLSAQSLNSGTVRLEWQNALFAASKGKTRIIPVRVDATPVPPVLLQTLYIDMHTVGLEAAIAQIVNVCQGNASFTPQHLGFSNLTHSLMKGENGAIDIKIVASHFLEPNPSFMVLIGNKQEEVSHGISGASITSGGFHSDIVLDNGSKHNAIVVRPMNATLSPAFPIRIKLTKQSSVELDFRGLLHQTSEEKWTQVPYKPAL